MKPFTPIKDNKTPVSMYIQLYRHIREEIISGSLPAGSKLPSIRNLALASGVSVTTVNQAYNQLLTEGYILSKPQSGYYVAEIPKISLTGSPSDVYSLDLGDSSFDKSRYLYDLAAFDFVKWKRCISRVYNEYPHLLLFEGDVQGEEPLRFEICKYLYSARGVAASPEQVVIGAGTQQLTSHLCRILSQMGIDLACTEDPGYIPIMQIFSDSGFGISKIPVKEDGIDISKLPVNIRSAVYVSPANQFPTGSVMPIANRYKLLSWASLNKSIILEDDYNSELRYFGKPIPALQGLDEEGRVVYLGSFSSTLYPAIRISYMILPPDMAKIFSDFKGDYTQTCSKAEQLALALFMEDGYYQSHIRKVRSLYSQKLQGALNAFEKYGKDLVVPANTKSGINMIIDVNSDLSEEELSERASRLSLHVSPLLSSQQQKKRRMIFYYNQIPLDDMDEVIKKLVKAWKK